MACDHLCHNFYEVIFLLQYILHPSWGQCAPTKTFLIQTWSKVLIVYEIFIHLSSICEPLEDEEEAPQQKTPTATGKRLSPPLPQALLVALWPRHPPPHGWRHLGWSSTAGPSKEDPTRGDSAQTFYQHNRLRWTVWTCSSSFPTINFGPNTSNTTLKMLQVPWTAIAWEFLPRNSMWAFGAWSVGSLCMLYALRLVDDFICNGTLSASNPPQPMWPSIPTVSVSTAVPLAGSCRAVIFVSWRLVNLRFNTKLLQHALTRSSCAEVCLLCAEALQSHTTKSLVKISSDSFVVRFKLRQFWASWWR